MTTFAVGDRVRVPRWAHEAGKPNTGTVAHVSERTIEVLQDGYQYPDGCATHTLGAGSFKPEGLALVGPTFTKGDKVVAVEGNDHLGIKAGVVYTVVGSWGDGEATTLNVKSSSGRRAWADAKRFKQYDPKPQQFELRYGDKVKNLHTGRVGQVFRNSRGELYVYDTVRPIRDGVPAAALEGYEDEYPGTYDIVFRRDSEEPW